MKKVFLLATAALMMGGVALACDGGKGKKCKKSSSSCCKKSGKKCCKKDKADKEKEKETAKL